MKFSKWHPCALYVPTLAYALVSFYAFFISLNTKLGQKGAWTRVYIFGLQIWGWDPTRRYKTSRIHDVLNVFWDLIKYPKKVMWIMYTINSQTYHLHYPSSWRNLFLCYHPQLLSQSSSTICWLTYSSCYHLFLTLARHRQPLLPLPLSHYLVWLRRRERGTCNTSGFVALRNSIGKSSPITR